MGFSQGINRIRIVFGVFIFFAIFVLSQNAFGVSTISGTVYDKQRNPLPNMEVELQNDYYQMIGLTQTDGSGRYQFNGLRDGRYSVRVYAFRYDLEDQTIPQEINTQNVRGGEGSGYFLVDFYLSPKKGGLAESELGVVFAQEVPADAKKLYNKGLEEFSKKQTDQAIMTLNEAVKVFPEYFLALYRIGKELWVKQKYQDSIPFLFKAAEVNPKSAATFYYLGSALGKLGKEYNKSAVAALKEAYTLAPASIQILFALGKAERVEGQFTEAEKHLLQAKKLSPNSVPEIHKELAQLYANDLKKYKEAADELELFVKSSKLTADDEKKTKKIISDLREKAKTQGS
jgi:tetratricopeptide (TPR) repeat protein